MLPGESRSPERAFFVPTGACFICRRGFLQLCFGFRVPIPIFVIRLCGNQERDGLGYENRIEPFCRGGRGSAGCRLRRRQGRFTGTYALVGDPATGQVLSGTYADGTPWDSSYAVEKMTKRELRLRALKDGVVSVYSGVAIPAAVKDGVTAGRLRSAAQGESFL